jgi:hypothetical protein
VTLLPALPRNQGLPIRDEKERDDDVTRRTVDRSGQAEMVRRGRFSRAQGDYFLPQEGGERQRTHAGWQPRTVYFSPDEGWSSTAGRGCGEK